MSALSERWALSWEASISGYSHIVQLAASARKARKKYTFGQNGRKERSFRKNSRASKGLACKIHETDEEPLPYLVLPARLRIADSWSALSKLALTEGCLCSAGQGVSSSAKRRVLVPQTSYCDEAEP